MTSSKKHWSDGYLVPGEQFEYAFEDIGNRTQTRAGGDEYGGYLRSASYSVNSANQITSRDVPNAVDVIGVADARSTVTVNGQTGYRRVEFYRNELSIDNSSAPVWQSITNKAVQGVSTNTVTGNVFLPKTPEVFGYDADGNRANDGRWVFTWDGENRPVTIQTKTDAPAGSMRKLTLSYDYLGRLIERVIYQDNTYRTNRFLYDGWNMIAIVEPGSSIPRTALTWGTDLSGTMQGAGGVGGLLFAKVDAELNECVVNDGNGNVVALVRASNGTVNGRYEYGPFGEPIRESGTYAEDCPIRFSSKFYDRETGLSYYGFRWYDASTGTWLSKEPLGEMSSKNLYQHCDNNPVTSIDVLGLYSSQGHYYATYIAAMIAGRANAMETAFYAELPDEINAAAAVPRDYRFLQVVGNIPTFELASPALSRIQRYLHSLDGGRAGPRRDCLRRLLQRGGLAAWEEGFLMHALGDAYGHSYPDPRRFIEIGSPRELIRRPNPNFNQHMLYTAPLGHSLQGHEPDQVWPRADLFAEYMTDVATILNRGPLAQGQLDMLNAVLDHTRQPLAQNQTESGAMRDLAVGFGFPRLGYDPDRSGSLSREEFAEQNPTPGFPLTLPTDAEIQNLIDRITRECCGR